MTNFNVNFNGKTIEEKIELIKYLNVKLNNSSFSMLCYERQHYVGLISNNDYDTFNIEFRLSTCQEDGYVSVSICNCVFLWITDMRITILN